MIPEKWQTIVGNIKDNFDVVDEGHIHSNDDGGTEIDFIVFDGPLGRIRLEFIISPVVLDKKTTYSKRIGSETKVDYVYSETEKSYNLAAYKWNDSASDWQEIEAGHFI